MDQSSNPKRLQSVEAGRYHKLDGMTYLEKIYGFQDARRTLKNAFWLRICVNYDRKI